MVSYHDKDIRARNDSAFPLLRKDIGNVLDWGTLKRKNEIKQVLEWIARRLDNDDTPEPSKKKRRGRK